MSDLMTSFGDFPHGRRPDFEHLSGPQGGPPHHHGNHVHQHKEHKHKHHKGKNHHGEPAPPPPPPSGELAENMWIPGSSPHHNEAPPPPPHHDGHGKHLHKVHKHKHHKGKKHHDEPAPPPGESSVNRWVDENSSAVLANELGMEGHKKKKKHNEKHPHKPFCDIEKLEATSTVFNFSPEEFQRAGVFLSGYFSRGGHVRLSKSSDKSVTDVKVNVTLYSGREELNKEVKLSAFDHEGQYAVQIERGHFKGALPPSGEPPQDSPRNDGPDYEKVQKGHHDDDKEDHKQENCLVYNVDIEFPSNVDYFEDLQLHIKSAQRIEGGAGLEGIEFGSVHAGLGHGAIIFHVRYIHICIIQFTTVY